MPAWQPESSTAGRYRVFVRAQLPLLSATVVVALLVLIADPRVFRSQLFLLGLAVIAFASVAAVAFPWEKVKPDWLIVVAFVDVVGIAMILDAVVPVTWAVGMLGVIPILWMSYGFRSRDLVVACLAALFLAGFPYLVDGELPGSRREWANLVMLPCLALAVAVVVRIAASRLRQTQDDLRQGSEQMAVSLQRAIDAEAVSRGILNTVDVGVAFYTADNQLLVSNPQASAMVEAVGFRIDEPPYAGPEVRQADRVTPIPFEEQIIPRALRGELIANHLEWLGPEGDQRAILASSRRVRREDGALLGTVVVAHDVTQLATAISVREDFLKTVTHELRTPLTSIIGYLDLAADELAEHGVEMGPSLQIVSRNATELLDRVSALLALSESTVRLTLDRLDLAELVSQEVTKTRGSAREASLSLHTEIDGPLVAVVDGRRLRQVVVNLLSNAIKYTPDGGSIRVSLRASGGNAILEVSDTGIGMSPSERDQVFDRFFRAKASRTGAIRGVGIGLSIAQDIVEAHGGRIAVESTPGVGSTFTVELPLDVEGVPQAAAEPAGSPAD